MPVQVLNVTLDKATFFVIQFFLKLVSQCGMCKYKIFVVLTYIINEVGSVIQKKGCMYIK